MKVSYDESIVLTTSVMFASLQQTATGSCGRLTELVLTAFAECLSGSVTRNGLPVNPMNADVLLNPAGLDPAKADAVEA